MMLQESREFALPLYPIHHHPILASFPLAHNVYYSCLCNKTGGGVQTVFLVEFCERLIYIHYLYYRTTN